MLSDDLSQVVTQAVTDVVSIGLAVLDTSGHVVWANRALRELVFGGADGGSAAAEPAAAHHPADPMTVAVRELTVDVGPGEHRIVTWHVAGARKLFAVGCRALDRQDTTRPGLRLYQVTDVTGARRTRERLAYLSSYDPLTAVANRPAVTRRLRSWLSRGHRPERGGALLLVDVDNFKDVNDLRGHEVGDELMRALAKLLRDRIGDQAFIGRLGGDEFAVILTTGDPAEALATAAGLCETVARTPVVAAGRMLRITISVGVAPRQLVNDGDLLLAHADLALHQAKAAGRNRAKLFAPEQYDDAAHRVALLGRVRDALEIGGMELDAQPIVDLVHNRIASHELLIRLRDGRRPHLGPAEFLPPIERTDLVLTLDRWVLSRAVATLASAAARAAGLRLEVNVSSRSLEDPTLGDWLVSELREANVPPARLGVEITETAAIASLDAARHLAEKLVGVGCRFTLDDFGAGFGSFAYLKHVPFTGVKIAGDFVRQADGGATDSVLVDAMVRVARGLGMTTVAEYVDREPLVDALREMGVGHGQGFHLGRPRPLVELVGQG
jgi:diguanylate cyclase (GGDEF)-like protein